MTAKNSEDKVLGESAVAGTIAAWNIANFVIDGCRLTYAKANLQGFGKYRRKSETPYASFSGPVSSRRPANAKVVSTQCRRLPKEDVDQINNEGSQTDLRPNKRAKVAK